MERLHAMLPPNSCDNHPEGLTSSIESDERREFDMEKQDPEEATKETSPSAKGDALWNHIVQEAVFSDSPHVLGYALQHMSEEMILNLTNCPAPFRENIRYLPPPSSRIIAFLLAQKGYDSLVQLLWSEKRRD